MIRTIVAVSFVVLVAGCMPTDAEVIPPSETPSDGGGTAAPDEALYADPVARVGGCIVYRIQDGENTVYATTPSGSSSGCSLAVVRNGGSQ